MQTLAPREAVDIEALLDRVYRVKQIHRLGGQGAAMSALGLTGGPRAPGATFSASDKVDTSSYAARMAAEMREMFLRLANAPDALLTAHEAVLALPDFFVELGEGESFLVWDEATAVAMGHRIRADRDASTITKMRRRSALRSSEVPACGQELVPAGPARPVTRIVTATLLVVSALNCERPHVSEVEVARMRPIYRAGHKGAVGHEAEYVTPLDVVAVERASYAVWHAALVMLTAALSALPGYEVLGPSAPAEPWAGERRVLKGKPQVSLVDEAPEAPKTTRRTAKRAISGAKSVSSKALKNKGKAPLAPPQKGAL